MTGRLAEVDEEADIDGPDDTSTVTVQADVGTPVEDLRRLSLIWRVKMTQIRMMQDRGYHLTALDAELQERAKTPEEFWFIMNEKIPGLDNPEAKTCSVTALWDTLTQTYVSKSNPDIHNLVVFLPPPLAKAFPTMRLNRVISVVKREPSIRFLDVIYEFPMTKVVRQKLAVTNRFVSEWSYADLLMPIMQSVYVGASFRVLSPEEFNEAYKADPVAARAGLPALCKDDPLVRYHQWTMDTVVRSTEIGDVNVAVTKLLKDYVVSNNTIFATVDSTEQPSA